MTMTESPADLLALDEDAFQSLVEQDMRRPDDGRVLRAALRSPEVVDRTYATLLSMLKSVEGQLAARREDLEVLRAKCLARGPAGKREWDEANTKYAKTRAGSLRFKVGVEQSLMDVRRIRDNRRSALFEDEANERLHARVQVLENAIRKHRASFSAEDEPGEDDVELWAWLPEEQ